MSSTAAEPNLPGSATATAALAADSPEAVVERAGYKPELRRSLRFFSMFAIAFSIISITTGIFLNYGFGLAYWGPASIWTWPIVGVGNMAIALVVAELGTRIPLAGYAYQWSARLVNPTYGWFVGFAGLLYMAVGGGAIMLGVASPLLLSEFNVEQPEPAPGAHGGDHLDDPAGADQPHQHPGRGAGQQRRGVYRDRRDRRVRRAAVRPVGGALQAHAVRRRHPHQHRVGLPQPDVVRVRAGRAARRVHPGRVRARRRHVGGRGEPPEQRAAGRPVGGGRLRGPGHDRADRLHGRHPQPQDGRGRPAAAAGHRGLLAAVLAGQGVRGVRDLLDVRDPGRRVAAPRPGWCTRCRGTTCCRSPVTCGRSTGAARPRSWRCWCSASSTSA